MECGRNLVRIDTNQYISMVGCYEPHSLNFLISSELLWLTKAVEEEILSVVLCKGDQENICLSIGASIKSLRAGESLSQLWKARADNLQDRQEWNPTAVPFNACSFKFPTLPALLQTQIMVICNTSFPPVCLLDGEHFFSSLWLYWLLHSFCTLLQK